MSATSLQVDQAEGADEQRTKRLFIGVLSSVLGVDQTYSGEDGSPSSRTGTYSIANPDGTYSQLGQPVSNHTTNPISQLTGIPAGWLMIAAAAFYFMKK